MKEFVNKLGLQFEKACMYADLKYGKIIDTIRLETTSAKEMRSYAIDHFFEERVMYITDVRGLGFRWPDNEKEKERWYDMVCRGSAASLPRITRSQTMHMKPGSEYRYTPQLVKKKWYHLQGKAKIIVRKEII
jgi:hypothetical protein